MRGKIFILFFSQWAALTALLSLSAFAFSAWKAQNELFLPMAGGAAVALVILLISVFVIRRSGLQMAYEVAWVLYPLLILLLPASTITASWFMWDAIDRASYNPWLASIPGILFGVFLFIRTFEIRFMPSVEDI